MKRWDNVRLTKMKISGFRCFGKEETAIDFDDTTVLIGANNSGKTATMSALAKVISNNSSERIIVKSDFHLSKGVNPEDVESASLYIELIFSFPELEKEDADLSAVPIYYRNFVVKSKGSVPYIRIRLESLWEKSTSIDGSIETEVNFYVCEESLGCPIDKKHKITRKELDAIRLFYIPAIRNIDKDVKFMSGTLIYRLLNLIKWTEETKLSIKTKSIQLNDVITGETQVRLIDDILSSNWSQYNMDFRFKKSKIMFSSSEISELLKKVNIGFSPSVVDRDVSIEELGDGSKSILYFSLVATLIEAERKILELGLNDEIKVPVMTILVAEEPENHIAPHMLGQLLDSISKISNFDNGQVIISSHSPGIIERVNPINIRLLNNSKDSFSTIVNKIHIPINKIEEYKYTKDAIQANPHIYFSKLVIVVEGDSEKLVLPRYFKAHDIDLDKNHISIISIDTRFVNQIWKLLEDIQIPYITFVDIDGERSVGGYKKIEYLLNQLKKIGKIDDLILDSGKHLFKDKINEEMKTWKETRDTVYKSWRNTLEEYDIFLSYPLDLDFLLLKKYKNHYINTLENAEGPFVKGKGKIIDLETLDIMSPEYQNKMNVAIEHTLKSDGGDGSTFTEEERKLMIWYDYFFLSKGKVKSHFKSFNNLSDKELVENEPKVITRLIENVKKKGFGIIS